MKILKAIVFIIIIQAFSNIIYAQVSGFLGKKNIISGSLFMKSSFVLPNKNGNNGYFSFNDHYSIEFERVISRRFSTKLHGTTFKSVYELKAGSFLTGLDKFTSTFTSKALGLDFIFYRKSNIAPLGAYISGGFDVFFSDVNIDTTLINPNLINSYFVTKFSYNHINTIHLGANVKTGIKQIFLNCISFDINFQLGCILTKPQMPEDMTLDATYGTSPNDIKSQLGYRLWGHYLWGVNCSLGFIF